MSPPGRVLVARRSGDDAAGIPRTRALPLTWLVNGRHVDSAPFRRHAQWLPDGPGQVRITVIDGAGRAASSAVWLQ